MTSRDFSKLCKEKGFFKAGDSYYRCIGEGIFQHIFIGEKDKLLADQAMYSPFHRYERTIKIYVRSMYDDYSQSSEKIASALGPYVSVYSLIGENEPTRFEGWDKVSDYMRDYGFPVLDLLKTQAALMQHASSWYKQGHSLALFETYLFCGEYDRAASALEKAFAESWFSLLLACQHAECSQGQKKQITIDCSPNVGIHGLAEKLNHAPFFLEKYRLTKPMNQKDAKEYLSKNYQRNMVYLQQLGLPIQEERHREDWFKN